MGPSYYPTYRILLPPFCFPFKSPPSFSSSSPTPSQVERTGKRDRMLEYCSVRFFRDREWRVDPVPRSRWTEDKPYGSLVKAWRRGCSRLPEIRVRGIKRTSLLLAVPVQKAASNGNSSLTFCQILIVTTIKPIFCFEDFHKVQIVLLFLNTTANVIKMK